MPTATKDWRCSGCGMVSSDRVRRCDCITDCLYIYDGKKILRETKLKQGAAEMMPQPYFTERPTMQLRWNNGTLEQAFERGMSAEHSETVWRAVPSI